MNKEIILDIVNWIKDYINSANAKGVVLGMSGGKDSLIVCKLCTMALGENNVLGVIMPNGEMIDYTDAKRTCELLGIKHFVVNINDVYSNLLNKTNEVIKDYNTEINDVTKINTAPRIRMTLLYSIAGSLNYLVANTSNLSEILTGYSTKWGDNVGDFAPLANFTKTEVCKIGELLDLPYDLVYKIPSDGLSGKSDEDKMGISYKNLDEYIRTGKNNKDVEKIKKLNKISYHKRKGVIKYENKLKSFL